MNKIEKILFQALVFLIPTNLAYHWITQEAYVNGILIDYLIPKLYLSDIPIIFLLLIWILKSRQIWQKKKVNLDYNSLLNPYSFLLILSYFIFVRGLFSQSPLAAIWYWIKIFEYSLFYLWFKDHFWKGSSLNFRRISRLLLPPLIISLLFQSTLGIYQFMFQKSFAGFWFFGETTLSSSPHIAKANLPFLLPHLGRSLFITPYGTTPHSNVFAGFLSFGTILLYTLSRGNGKSGIYQKYILYITYILSAIALAISLSGSAWISLLVAFSLIGLLKTSSKHQHWVLTFFALSLVATFLFIQTPNNPIIDDYSQSRRLDLNQIATKIIQHKPIVGVGLNNFTSQMKNYGNVSSTTQFLQPPHNIFLLILSEVGALGLYLLYLLVQKIKRSKSRLLLIPIIALLLVGLLDHYPITLQTGQLLTILSLSII
ncbi:O-antigen ligase family protein [Patescibacteria group bacterium]